MTSKTLINNSFTSIAIDRTRNNYTHFLDYNFNYEISLSKEPKLYRMIILKDCTILVNITYKSQ